MQGGLFYAYAKQLTENWDGRYLIIFADRATADEWWRAVYDSVASGYQRFREVKRVSPQFYTHDPASGGNIMQTINDQRCARRFVHRVIFSSLYDMVGRVYGVIPPLNYTDHISGRAYFIRSTLRPNQYWHYDGKNIVISSTHQTKFTVSAQSARYPRADIDGLVMIHNDDVVISVRDTTITVTGTSIPFAHFDGGFSTGEGGELIHTGDGYGDSWELV
ncbi:hypothetical protein BS47DRAFT_1290216 [Hydnum rufescens UP504]|uniref:Uncharacterized protein n=1 Tax=Hydnum rufescens UP504 TaxID=1448309 RepID=A0A9P6B5B0_9AGAM|nr:hypothetical protein BS47DRAFT_1290216 [Hydnum rufescens UP504]